MRFLLDTHAFLWTLLHKNKITPKIWAQLEAVDNQLFLSAASAWEIAIKVALGKLVIPGDPAVYVPRRARQANILSLPITEDHALAVRALPMHHGDPFDRLLVAQAQLESLTIVTADPQFTKYDVNCLMM
ncbi:MAG: type II toxin-antitoxin system VapC family toxin [Vulcanimicrobiaceae bacterium]